MVEVRYSIYFLQTLPCFGGVVEVEVDPSNFNRRRWGRVVVEVRYSIYFPVLGVWYFNFNWIRRGTGGGEVW